MSTTKVRDDRGNSLSRLPQEGVLSCPVEPLPEHLERTAVAVAESLAREQQWAPGELEEVRGMLSWWEGRRSV